MDQDVKVTEQGEVDAVAPDLDAELRKAQEALGVPSEFAVALEGITAATTDEAEDWFKEYESALEERGADQELASKWEAIKARLREYRASHSPSDAASSKEPVRGTPTVTAEVATAVSQRRAIVANWAGHPVLSRLFSDWTALWLPPEPAALPRWQSVALAAGAALAKRHPDLADGFLASLEVDAARSDQIYRELIVAFADPAIQHRQGTARPKAALRIAYGHSGACAFVGAPDRIWESGIEALHAHAAAAITWGIRAFREDELLGGWVLDHSMLARAREQRLLLARLPDLCRSGGNDPRPLLIVVFECAYAGTPLERRLLTGAARAILDEYDPIISVEYLPDWADAAFDAGRTLAREHREDARGLVAEILRVIDAEAYEDQRDLSARLLATLKDPRGARRVDIYGGLIDVIRDRWPALLRGHTYGSHLWLWWRTFDQAFWAGIFAELFADGDLPSREWVEQFRAEKRDVLPSTEN